MAFYLDYLDLIGKQQYVFLISKPINNIKKSPDPVLFDSCNVRRLEQHSYHIRMCPQHRSDVILFGGWGWVKNRSYVVIFALNCMEILKLVMIISQYVHEYCILADTELLFFKTLSMLFI